MYLNNDYINYRGKSNREDLYTLFAITLVNIFNIYFLTLSLSSLPALNTGTIISGIDISS